jgi:nicotinamidase-related amidase
MPGTQGAELVDQVKPIEDLRLDGAALLSGDLQELGANEWAVYRPRWGAFYGTRLEDHLRALGVSTIVICGSNFSTAIRATIYEASARDFRVVLVPDAVTGVADDDLSELARIGVYLMNADCCASWLKSPIRSAAA